MKKTKKWEVETTLTARAESGRPMAALMDMGGMPRENAALAVVMFSTAASPFGEPEGREYASSISEQLFNAAEAGGFTSRTEFVRLIEAGVMELRLLELGGEVVRAIGGTAEFFALLELITTPVGMMGNTQ